MVDDDDMMNLIHKQIIESSGVNAIIDIVKNGREAMEYLQRQEKGKTIIPNLIFLDINMPEMNGWEFLDKFKEFPAEHRAKIVIVMMTTSTDRDDLYHAVETEVKKFVNKLLTSEKFEEIIASHFT